MGWARMDDGYMMHPKILEAGVWAELLDRRAIEWCAKNETDGLVTLSSLKMIGRGISKVPVRVAKLLEVGRWTVNDGGGYLVHDFLKYNPSKADRERQREQGRERVQKHRLSTGSNGVTNTCHSKGRGSLSLNPEIRVRSILRCGACGQLDIDCDCTKAETA